MTPEEEAQQKAEHEEDPENCVWPYPEHDYDLVSEQDGQRVYNCRRCDAESIEEEDE